MTRLRTANRRRLRILERGAFTVRAIRRISKRRRPTWETMSREEVLADLRRMYDGMSRQERRAWLYGDFADDGGPSQ